MTWSTRAAKLERLLGRLGGMIRRMRYLSSSSGFWQVEGVSAEEGSPETEPPLEVFHGVGFVTRPKNGSDAEVIVAKIGGASGHKVVIASRDREQEFTLDDDDECAVFNSTAVVYFKKDGTIEARSRAGAAVALALKSDVDAIKQVLTTWTPVPNDGGAALKTKAQADLASIPVGTTTLKAE
jgi:phage gp45-like